MLKTCDTYLRHHNKQTKEPMLMALIGQAEPWQQVDTDVVHLNGKDPLTYSNYPEEAQLFSPVVSPLENLKCYLLPVTLARLGKGMYSLTRADPDYLICMLRSNYSHSY